MASRSSRVRTLSLVLLVIGAGLLVAFSPAARDALAGGKGAWKQNLVTGLESTDSEARRQAVAQVDTDDKDGVKALLKILAMRELKTIDWYVRTAAIETLGKTKAEAALAELAKGLKSPDVAVREGTILALGKAKDRARRDEIAKALDDKDPVVRRAAARALGCFVEVETVDALLDRLEKEDPKKNHREVATIVEVLAKLTERKLGLDRAAWREWWDKAKGDDYKFPSEMTPEEKEALAKKEAEAGKEKDKKAEEPITTTVRGIPLTYKETGAVEGVPLLVIHDDTWKPSYYEPYLASLNDTCRIFFIELPSIVKLEESLKKEGKKLKYDLSMPEYPVDQLTDAFDELRKQYKFEKFAVMAHGFTTLIGQKYLSKYPQNVSHMILVGAMPGGEAYGIMLDRLRSKATVAKDKELERLVDSLFVTDTKTKKAFYDAKTDAEHEALQRKMFSIMFANPQDPEIFAIWERCKKETLTSLKKKREEECLMPAFDTSRELKPPVPVLVIMGEKSIWTSVGDGERVQKSYPVSQLVVLKESAMMPWFDENEKFTQAVKDFLKRHPLKKGK